MSVGAVTQSVNFQNNDVVLVLGENLDQGGNDHRNGVGKSTIVNALCYALYGQALTNIRLGNLINKTNEKGMMVTLDFEKDGHEYRIERGRSPNKFSLYVDNEECTTDDESQGENRSTQEYLERLLGINQIMFKQLVALNTYTEPFLSMKAADQRDIIEHLLGITALSEKATILKEHIKRSKDEIKQEQFRVDAIQEANKRIESNIQLLKTKSDGWEKNHQEQIQTIQSAIELLEQLDIDTEVSNHKLISEATQNRKDLNSLERDVQSLSRQLTSLESQKSRAQQQIDSLQENTCPTCGGTIDDSKHKTILKEHTETVSQTVEQIEEIESALLELGKEIDKIPAIPEKLPDVIYGSLEEAYDHKNKLDSLLKDLEREKSNHNPHQEQIEELENNGLQVVEYDELNRLTSDLEHQEFLLKLLTNKDSFIRKKIVDQNLGYLNSRLKSYLNELGLPHLVEFQSDLSVEISEHGRSMDFFNLSRGERTRLILGLSMSFRDIYESMNSPISLLFVDELIDSGLDTAGVESALGVLKKVSREQHKNVFLISHRDELIGRVNGLLRVIKSGGFTTFEEDNDAVM